MSHHAEKHGMRYSREYGIWQSMIGRCYRKSNGSYKNYGAKGITVCDKWKTFEGFFEDMGFCGDLCLDRIDNTKGYSKENCRWVTHKQNNRNKSNNVIVAGKTLAEWAEITGISKPVISYRLNKMKMDPFAAVTTPLMRVR